MLRLTCAGFLLIGLQVSVTAVAQGAGETEAFPASLKRTLELRSPAYLATARIEWALKDARNAGGHSFYFRWRASPNEFISDRLGDEAGVTNHNLDGTPAAMNPSRPRSVLIADGLEWTHTERLPLANVRRAGDVDAAFAVDLRQMGLNPADPLVPFSKYLDGPAKAKRTYAESREGDLQVVSATTTDVDPPAVLKWFIDPQKDFAVVKTQTLQGNEKLTETIYDLEEVDDVWFPRRARSFGNPDWDKPYRTVELIRAEFNRAEHPQALTPNDIGLEVGVNVVVEGGCLPLTFGFWDGGKVTDPMDYSRRYRAGELKQGPTVQREFHRMEMAQRLREERGVASQAASQGVDALSASAWEQYTFRFIKQHELTAEQATAARRILADCQQRAQRHLDTHREEVLAVQESPGSSGIVLNGGLFEVKQEVPEADRVRAERLFAPLNAIFREQLKPRLEALLTRAQRAKAEEAGSR